VFSLAFEGSKVSMDFLLRDWSTAELEPSTSQFIAWYFVLSACVLGFSCCANLLSQAVSAAARKRLHSKLLTHLLDCPIDFFEAFPVGRILSRLSGDVFVVDQGPML
jgi:ABC-type multidrug transport system fused ATPase/permease subunit